MTWRFEMTCAVVVVATILVPATLQPLFGKLDSEEQSFGLITCSDGQLVKG